MQFHSSKVEVTEDTSCFVERFSCLEVNDFDDNGSTLAVVFITRSDGNECPLSIGGIHIYSSANTHLLSSAESPFRGRYISIVAAIIP
jgi:hypothetical protein